MATAEEIEDFERAIQSTVEDCGMTPRCGGCQTCLRMQARTVDATAVENGATGVWNPIDELADTAFELGPQALLEAVRDWDYDADLSAWPDPEKWVLLAKLVTEAKAALSRAAEQIARELAGIYPYSQPIPFEGIAVLTLRGGAQRKAWDHDEARRDAVVKIADEMGVTVRAVEEVVGRWWEVCGPSGWKVTGLRALGLDPDEYCQKTSGPPSFQLE